MAYSSITDIFRSHGIYELGAADFAHVKVNPCLFERKCRGFEPRTAVFFVIPYYVPGEVNISRYAVSRDYHIYAEELQSALVPALTETLGGQWRMFCDNSPVDERHGAALCGLGGVGDSGLLISPVYGTYIFIAELLTDLPISELHIERRPAVDPCTHCGACASACPTGCLSDYSRPCLSAITQKKGNLSDSETRLMRSHSAIWGCDCCQSVCPLNISARPTPIEFFHTHRTPHLTYEFVSSMSDEEFRTRGYSWRGREVVLRNLKIAEDTSTKGE